MKSANGNNSAEARSANLHMTKLSLGHKRESRDIGTVTYQITAITDEDTNTSTFADLLEPAPIQLFRVIWH